MHKCTNLNRDGVFYCNACEFVGTLYEAIWHTVKNQFVVAPPERKRP